LRVLYRWYSFCVYSVLDKLINKEERFTVWYLILIAVLTWMEKRRRIWRYSVERKEVLSVLGWTCSFL
jgi:CRISPR/Cas system-associated endonuclease Cas3-HD